MADGTTVRHRRLRTREIFGHESHGHRAFADGGRDTIHGPSAHVAGGKHAGNAGLERQRRPRFFPDAGKRFMSRHIAACQDESFGIAEYRVRKPLAAWTCADVYEHGFDVLDDKRIILGTTQPGALEAAIAFHALQDRVAPYANARNCSD